MSTNFPRCFPPTHGVNLSVLSVNPPELTTESTIESTVDIYPPSAPALDWRMQLDSDDGDGDTTHTPIISPDLPRTALSLNRDCIIWTPVDRPYALASHLDPSFNGGNFIPLGLYGQLFGAIVPHESPNFPGANTERGAGLMKLEELTLRNMFEAERLLALSRYLLSIEIAVANDENLLRGIVTRIENADESDHATTAAGGASNPSDAPSASGASGASTKGFSIPDRIEVSFLRNGSVPLPNFATAFAWASHYSSDLINPARLSVLLPALPQVIDGDSTSPSALDLPHYTAVKKQLERIESLSLGSYYSQTPDQGHGARIELPQNTTPWVFGNFTDDAAARRAINPRAHFTISHPSRRLAQQFSGMSSADFPSHRRIRRLPSFESIAHRHPADQHNEHPPFFYSAPLHTRHESLARFGLNQHGLAPRINHLYFHFSRKATGLAFADLWLDRYFSSQRWLTDFLAYGYSYADFIGFIRSHWIPGLARTIANKRRSVEIEGGTRDSKTVGRNPRKETATDRAIIDGIDDFLRMTQVY